MIKENILDFGPADLADFFLQIGEKPFRARQVMQWIYQKLVMDFEKMSNLNLSLRSKLVQSSCIKLPKILKEQLSLDGSYKWLVSLDEKNCVETVFIPEPHRGTLCVSTQVGCPLGCIFCDTAYQGFNRNLTTGEIIGQVLIALQVLFSKDQKYGNKRNIITNIVFMGMGEPLLNLDNVVQAISLMRSDFGFGISKRRITISTAGVVPAVYRLRDMVDVSLAVSLHAPNDDLRSQLVPINRKYPLDILLKACANYITDKAHRKITWEYVLIDGINDSIQHAIALSNLLRYIPSKVNLIPLNQTNYAKQYRGSTLEVAKTFRLALIHSGLLDVTIRKIRGNDISAACGQLVGSVVPKNYVRKQNEIS